MYTKVKFTEGFKDGTIFPDRSFAPGEEAVLSENELARVQSSGGVLQIVEQMIPNPLKTEKQLVRSEMNDPQNAENSINDLETHVPGLEEEQEEVRLRELQRQANPSVKKVGSESVFNEVPGQVEAEAMAKVEEARLERERKLKADREAGDQAEAQLAAEAVEEEREEYVEAAEKADRKKKKK